MNAQDKKLQKQRKQMIEDFNKRGIPHLDDGTNVEEVEIIDTLDYFAPEAKRPYVFQDPLKDFPDKMFAPKYHIVFEGEFTVLTEE